MLQRPHLLALAFSCALSLTPLAAQALPRESCAKLTSWVSTDTSLRHGYWGTEPVFRATITGTTMHNAEFVAWLDDPCFVSHEDIAVDEVPVNPHGLPDASVGHGMAATLLARIYGSSIADDFADAATTRLPNEIVLLGQRFAYVLHWVDETGVPGQYPAYTEWLEIWPRDAQLPDH